MATAVSGKKIIYLYRIHDNAGTASGKVIAFTTENGRTKSKDADSTATKDGSIRTPGVAEVEITCTSYLKKSSNSDTDITISDLEEAMDNDKLMEIWEANLDEPGSTIGKYKGRYFQGYITEIELTSNAEDFTEVSLTFGINGNGATGDVTVSASQEEAASYVFADAIPSNTLQGGEV